MLSWIAQISGDETSWALSQAASEDFFWKTLLRKAWIIDDETLETLISLLESQAQSRCIISNWSDVSELEQNAIARKMSKSEAELKQMKRMLTVNIIIALHSSDFDFLSLTLTNLLKFSSCNDQIKTIQSLAIDQMNLILIASTRWDKSVVFQTVSILRCDVCLLIMSLNLLKEKQISH